MKKIPLYGNLFTLHNERAGGGGKKIINKDATEMFVEIIIPFEMNTALLDVATRPTIEDSQVSAIVEMNT